MNVAELDELETIHIVHRALLSDNQTALVIPDIWFMNTPPADVAAEWTIKTPKWFYILDKIDAGITRMNHDDMVDFGWGDV